MSDNTACQLQSVHASRRAQSATDGQGRFVPLRTATRSGNNSSIFAAMVLAKK